MTFRISQRGKEYLETAQTLLRAAQTMTDRAIAGQLKALADDYQRRAEKASFAVERAANAAEPLEVVTFKLALFPALGLARLHLLYSAVDFALDAMTKHRLI